MTGWTQAAVAETAMPAPEKNRHKIVLAIVLALMSLLTALVFMPQVSACGFHDLENIV